MSHTHFDSPFRSVGCAECRDTAALGFAFTMAFQPIVDVANRRLFAYEALVRGPDEESAASILAQVTDQNRYRFDQSCRIRAIELASRLGLQQIPDCKLSIMGVSNSRLSRAARAINSRGSDISAGVILLTTSSAE
jgi:EAL domain-containing protein (putative c-di-GMP-specific phosphodiesterase class I)